MTDFIPLTVTAQQRRNLAKLAAYLENLPRDYGNFGMAMFFDAYWRPVRMRGLLPVMDCGTIACAVGHGPAAGVRLSHNEVIDGFIVWPRYANRVFGAEFREFGMNMLPNIWNWAFDSIWTDFDNTPRGAAKRIRLALDKGIPAKFKSYVEKMHMEVDPSPYLIRSVRALYRAKVAK